MNETWDKVAILLFGVVMFGIGFVFGISIGAIFL